MLAVYKGSVDDKIVKALTATPRPRDLVITVEAGASKIKALAAAGVKVGAYFKTGGAHDPANGDKRDAAVWAAATAMLWYANGERVREPNQGWCWADLQRFAEPWADQVVIPRIRARLADVPAGSITVAMLDNWGAVWSGNMSPLPPDFDPTKYVAACSTVLARCRAAFPELAFLPNGWNDWNPPGLRGEAAWSDAHGLYFEGFRLKVGGAVYDAARLNERLRVCESTDADHGLFAVAHDYFAPTDFGKRLSTLAAFLVAGGARSYLHLDGTALGWQAPEQAIAAELGAPIGRLGMVGQVLERRFERGVAAVNVSGSAAAFDCAAWREARIGAGGATWGAPVARVLAHGEGVVALT